MKRLDLVVITLIVIAILAAPSAAKPGHHHGHNVPENFENNCTAQAAVSRHVTCDASGNFTAVQCQGRKCHCVDTLTGERIGPVDHKDRDTVGICDGAVTCESSRCGPKICSHGYRADANGCPTCMCEPPPPPVMCDYTLKELLKDDNCHCSCIMEGPMEVSGPGSKACLMCNFTCDEENRSDSCVSSPEDCPANTMLKSVGRHGEPTCVPVLMDGDKCSVKKPGRRAGPRDLGQDSTDCEDGSNCVQKGPRSFRCETPRQDTHCRMAQAQDSTIRCDKEGNYERLQCRPLVSNQSQPRPETCRCVVVTNGTTIEGSEVTLQGRDRKPDCRPKDCRVGGVRGRGRGRRRMFRVRHGETFFDAANCRQCQCTDGDPATFCTGMSASQCAVLTGTANCTLDDGTVLEHGAKMLLQCERCGCNNARARCVRDRKCEKETGVVPDPDERDMCETCSDLTSSPVCGPDFRNHDSECAAVYCAGIAPADLIDGTCQSLDVCELYPCNDTFTCVPTGAVACVGLSGCTEDQLRTCVDLDSLQCQTTIDSVNDTSSNNSTNGTSVQPEDLTVCGSDSITYSSICELLQSTVGVSVAYRGACDSEECQGGEVCGSDGVTYPNLCFLRSNSVARLDYPGPCVSESDTALENCALVEERGLCVVTESNCVLPVKPSTGCCPVCGGSVTVALDREAITSASLFDPIVQDIGYIVEELLGVFVRITCAIEFTLTEASDLEIIISLITRNSTELQSCVDQADEISALINQEFSSVGPAKRQAEDEEDVPQVYDYCVAASTAPLVQQSDGTTTGDAPGNTTGGACLLAAQIVTVVIVTLSALLLG